MKKVTRQLWPRSFQESVHRTVCSGLASCVIHVFVECTLTTNAGGLAGLRASRRRVGASPLCCSHNQTCLGASTTISRSAPPFPVGCFATAFSVRFSSFVASTVASTWQATSAVRDVPKHLLRLPNETSLPPSLPPAALPRPQTKRGQRRENK